MIRTVEHNLLAGALLVIAILLAFLGNLRAGLIVAVALFIGAALLASRMGGEFLPRLGKVPRPSTGNGATGASQCNATCAGGM